MPREALKHHERYPLVTIRMKPAEIACWQAWAADEGIPLARLVRLAVRERVALREALRMEQQRYEVEGR